MKLLVLMTALSVTAVAQEPGLPASGDDALSRLEASPRHAEWVTVEAGDGDALTAWLVYPERSEGAPVVVVIHEIFGLTDWIRAVADQLAAEGFIAVAPDLLSGKGPSGGGSASMDPQAARRTVGALERDEVIRRLTAAAHHAMALPAARGAFAVIGFCWGGSTSFAYAVRQTAVNAAVVYYGKSPDSGHERITAPILGLYGGDDNRVTSTVPEARDAMTKLRKRYEAEIYDGAGHGFLRAQGGRDGANLGATRQAWPRTIAFLRETLGER